MPKPRKSALTAAIADRMNVIGFAAFTLLPLGLIGQPILSEHIVSERPEPAVSEPTGQVAQLVGELADESLQKRQAAARLLLVMGPAIESQLRGALRHEKPAPKGYTLMEGSAHTFKLDPDSLLPRYGLNELDVLLSHLEAQRHLQSSVISLHYKNAPLIDVLRDFGTQADTEIRFGSWYNLVPFDWVRTNRVTVNLERATYWEALRAFEKSARLSSGLPGGRNQPCFFRLDRPFRDRSSSLSPSVVSGPFRITPLSVELSRRLDYKERRRSGLLKLTLLGEAEPKLQVERSAILRLEQCLDDRGASLLLPEKRTFEAAEPVTVSGWLFPVEVAEPRRGRRIKTLKGEISAATGPGQRYLSITNLPQAQGQSREFDGLRITLQLVRIEDQTHYEIDVAVSAPGGSPHALTFPGPEPLNVQLWDESLQSFKRQHDLFLAPNGVRREGDLEIASWHLSCNRPPATLTWLTPAETRWVTVPFELHDLPVPTN